MHALLLPPEIHYIRAMGIRGMVQTLVEVEVREIKMDHDLIQAETQVSGSVPHLLMVL